MEVHFPLVFLIILIFLNHQFKDTTNKRDVT